MKKATVSSLFGHSWVVDIVGHRVVETMAPVDGSSESFLSLEEAIEVIRARLNDEYYHALGAVISLKLHETGQIKFKPDVSRKPFADKLEVILPRLEKLNTGTGFEVKYCPDEFKIAEPFEVGTQIYALTLDTGRSDWVAPKPIILTSFITKRELVKLPDDTYRVEYNAKMDINHQDMISMRIGHNKIGDELEVIDFSVARNGQNTQMARPYFTCNPFMISHNPNALLKEYLASNAAFEAIEPMKVKNEARVGLTE